MNMKDFSSHDHFEAYARAPRLVIEKKHGKYIHETLHESSEFPKGTIFRTLSISGHKVVVGYWGRKNNGKHPYFAVNSVLHPKEKDCRFRRRLERMNVHLIPGKEIRLNGVTTLTGPSRKIIIRPIRVFK